MNASSIFNNFLDYYTYMERYVNDGSPSGFTQIHNTSFNTNPYTGLSSFHLLEFDDDDCETIIRGEENSLFSIGVNYSHPDSLKSSILLKAKRKQKESSILVTPTASSRTMLILNEKIRGFLKLTYDVSKIGRCTRDISCLSALASLETSQRFKECIDDGILPSTLAVLLETSCKVSKLVLQEDSFEWGTIFRRFEPYPNNDNQLLIVPAFSLFSTDKKNPEEEKLINQFIELSGQSPEEYLWNVIKITVDAHWNLVIKAALRPEMHAQNCMYELDRNYKLSRIIIKDMEDIDRDLFVAKFTNNDYNWNTYPYKCYDENSRDFMYQASYMYDFKLGEYLLSPIIKCVSNKFGLDEKIFERKIKDYVRSKYLPRLPFNYFSNESSWYYCKNVDRRPGESKKFFSKENPKFR